MRQRDRRCALGRRGTDDCGLLSTEVAVLMPFVLLFALVAVFVIRANQHTARTQAAADSAARSAAFFAAGSAEAQTAATAAADQVCQGAATTTITAAEAATATRPGLVTVRVTCTEDLGLDLFGPASTRTVAAEAVAAIEFWIAP